MPLTAQEIQREGYIKHDRQGHTGLRKFIVLGISGSSQADVFAAIPAIGATHPNDSLMVAEAINVTQEMEKANANGQLKFLADVNYTSNSDAIDSTIVPLSRPAVYSYNSSTEAEEIYLDYSSPRKAVKNSAGDIFSSQPVGLNSYQQVTVQRNEASFNLATIYGYNGTVNSNDWTTTNGYGISAGYARMDSIRATPESETINSITYDYWKVQYDFTLNPHTWRLSVEDLGFRQKIGSAQRTPIDDGHGQNVTEPTPLNGAGVSATGTTGATLTFKIYEEVSWSSLAL